MYGIAGAAAAYYGKTPAQLDVGEAALLAALLPAPEAGYGPLTHQCPAFFSAQLAAPMRPLAVCTYLSPLKLSLFS